MMTSLLVTSNMDVRCKQRVVIEFLYHEGIKEAEIVERLRKVYKDKALSQATVWWWLDRFKSSVLNEDSDEENIIVRKRKPKKYISDYFNSRNSGDEFQVRKYLLYCCIFVQ